MNEKSKTATLTKFRQEQEDFQAELPHVREQGAAALRRLLEAAQGHGGQSKVVASFLLSCYNGNRFKFDLSDFRLLDFGIFDDCIKVLRMDFSPQKEVHEYFEDGGRIFEQLATDWGIRDFTKS